MIVSSPMSSCSVAATIWSYSVWTPSTNRDVGKSVCQRKDVRYTALDHKPNALGAVHAASAVVGADVDLDALRGQDALDLRELNPSQFHYSLSDT